MSKAAVRKARDRCRHAGTDDRGFIELKDESLDGESLFKILQQVPGVEKVYWQSTKHSQNNPGTRDPGVPYDGTGHFIEQNVMVKSQLFKQPFEFELTRCKHTKTRGTCSLAFNTAPEGQLLEAWRIMRHAAGERTLDRIRSSNGTEVCEPNTVKSRGVCVEGG